LSVKNVTDSTADLYFYGEIAGDEWDKWTDTDTCPQDVIDALKAADGKDVNIYINSPGGSVFGGVAIYNILKRHQGKKTVHIDAVAASIASVIAMCGDTIIMPSNACLMIHNPISIVYGNAAEMRKMADDLDIIQTSITEIYKTKLKQDADIETIKELMDAETWLTASEASKYFEIETVECNTAAAKVDFEKLNCYKNIPENIKNNFQQENKKNEEQEKEKLLIELALLDI
jgi:ATP-dependent Clp endopeptidase proteolytic subunit ClpP